MTINELKIIAAKDMDEADLIAAALDDMAVLRKSKLYTSEIIRECLKTLGMRRIYD